MATRLEEIWSWWGEQKRKIRQRKDLGVIKYKTDRQTEKLRELRERMSQSEVAVEARNLPNEIRFSEL
jgi:flagellar motor switch protein FliM